MADDDRPVYYRLNDDGEYIPVKVEETMEWCFYHSDARSYKGNDYERVCIYGLPGRNRGKCDMGFADLVRGEYDDG